MMVGHQLETKMLMLFSTIHKLLIVVTLVLLIGQHLQQVQVQVQFFTIFPMVLVDGQDPIS
jgi:hypothetical protein